MLEVVTTIRQAEEQGEELRRQARIKTKEVEQKAVQDGEALLEERKKEAAESAAKHVEQANKEARARIASAKSVADRNRQLLEAEAEGKLDQAALFVFERIVDSL